MRRGLIFFFAAYVLSGCGSSTATTTPTASPKGASPPSEFYEEVRSGNFQMGQAQDLVAEAYAEAERIPGRGDAREEIVETLDAVGQTLGAFREPPPSPEEFQKQVLAHKKKRDQAVVEANDAIQDLDILRAIISDVLEAKIDERTADRLSTLDTLLDDSIQALTDAIEAYGGTVEQPIG